jgi:hypothetical protein
VATLDPVEFVARHGVVLASGRGPVPNLAEAVAGAPIRGGWWGHPKGQEIFRALQVVGDSPDVLSFRLVERKITLVHRRLWPALVRLAGQLGNERLKAAANLRPAARSVLSGANWSDLTAGDVGPLRCRLCVQSEHGGEDGRSAGGSGRGKRITSTRRHAVGWEHRCAPRRNRRCARAAVKDEGRTASGNPAQIRPCIGRRVLPWRTHEIMDRDRAR